MSTLITTYLLSNEICGSYIWIDYHKVPLKVSINTQKLRYKHKHGSDWTHTKIVESTIIIVLKLSENRNFPRSKSLNSDSILMDAVTCCEKRKPFFGKNPVNFKKYLIYTKISPMHEFISNLVYPALVWDQR